MTIDFQTWMRAVWNSIMEPTATAKQALALKFPAEALWMGLALSAVLNVLIVGVLQSISTVPIAMEEQGFAATPFGYLGIVGIFLPLFVLSIYQTGRWIGSQATLLDTLTIMVWFQAVSLTLELIQLVLVLISPVIAALFGMLALGAMLWCFINFINVLHGFSNLIKTAVSIVLALIAATLIAGIILALFGITTPGGTV